MKILIDNPVYQTLVFGIIFGIVFLLFFSKKQKYTPFLLTQELKGFAILTIIFGHIGYFLSINQQFLFPFSIMSGVGVNLFFFLSGYGLTRSQMNKEEGSIQFYKRKLPKLFIPFWIVLAIVLFAGFIFLDKSYSLSFIIQSILGIFTHADMYTDINSPMWYFSLILLYYILFPLLFNKKRPWITASALYLIVWAIVYIDPIKLSGVIGLYEVHLAAFPLGVLTVWFTQSQKNITESIVHIYKKYETYMYPILLSTTLLLLGYFAIHSGVGESVYVEQWMSIWSMGIVLLLFIIKKRESKLLSIFGLFSYEIYLFHWPILYYYDVFYKNLPAWIATILYLILFVLLAMMLKKTSKALGNLQIGPKTNL